MPDDDPNAPTIPAPAVPGQTMPAIHEPVHTLSTGAELIARLNVDCAEIVVVQRTNDRSRWITIAGDACEHCLRIVASWCRRPMGLLAKNAIPRRAGALRISVSAPDCAREHCHSALFALSKRGQADPNWHICPEMPARTGPDDVEYVCAACDKELRAWMQSPMSGILFLTDERIAAVAAEREEREKRERKQHPEQYNHARRHRGKK